MFGPYNCDSVLTFICNSGFNMVGNNTITCQSNKEWSGLVPSCQQQEQEECTCSNPPGMENGVLSPSQGPYNCNSFVTYQCDSGYTLQGNNRLQCQSSRAWNGIAPSCQQQQGKASVTLSLHV